MNYLLESTVCITIFYGLYYLIFRRLTFVRLNRIYLLTSLVVGLSLPLISFQINEVVKVPTRIAYEETSSVPLLMNGSMPLISNIPIEEPFDWNFIWQGIYVLGILFMLMKFSITIYKILKIRGILSEKGFISTKSKYANSSFFNLIFIDDSNLSENEINQILEHEKWHITLFHSYDLLFVEILKMIFWFNPILWLYQRSLSEVHEYEVDTRMVQTHSPQMYAQLLLKLATSCSQLATTHQFSRKPLTDRIHFLFTKQKSVPMKRLVYLSVLPILGAFFMAFSVEKVVDYQVVDNPDETYFKVYKKPDAQVNNEVQVKSDKVVSNLTYGKNRVALSITPNDISEVKALDEAIKYFKKIGFNLEMTRFEFNNNKKELSKIELTLTEIAENKKKYRSKITDTKSDLPSKFTFDLKKMKRKGLDDIITIFADRSTGEYFVAPLAPPPPPPVPPSPPKVPPAPPKPPLPPVKIGMNKTQEWDKYKIASFTKNIKEILIKSSQITFKGQKLKDGMYMSKPITQKEWQDFLNYINVDKNISIEFKRKMIPDNWSKLNIKSDKLPVTSVSFEQATEYCNWKSKLLNFKSKKNSDKVNYVTIVTSEIKNRKPMRFRLPTEEEWQMAARKKLVSDKSDQIGFYTIWEMSYKYEKGF